jgi:aromatic ring-opening dioxygenase catalytic subunit (LigB family)
MRTPRSLLHLTTLLTLHHPTSFALSTSNTTSNLLLNFPISSFSTNMTRLAPVIALSHGGGPMPLLGDPRHAAIAHSLRTKVPKILRLGTPEAPRAIVVVTAHWSTDKVTVSTGSKPAVLYDYSGFPPESYEIRHDAPGSPEVAGEVERALREKGVECGRDGERGTLRYFHMCCLISCEQD